MLLHIHMYVCLYVCVCNSMHLFNYLGVSSLPAVSKETRKLPSITCLENVLHLSFFEIMEAVIKILFKPNSKANCSYNIKYYLICFSL